MQRFLNLSSKDRSAFFKEAAASMGAGVSPAIIEKDFWVCWTLEQLFASGIADNIIFKGGTSLSKVYGGERRLDMAEFMTIAEKLGIDPVKILKSL